MVLSRWGCIWNERYPGVRRDKVIPWDHYMGLWTVTKDWTVIGLIVAFRGLTAAFRGLSVGILGWEGYLRISLTHLKPIDYLPSF